VRVSSGDPALGALNFSFDAGVGSVGVTSNGAMTCMGSSFGTITAFDSLGEVIATAPLELRDSTDCGSDSVTYGVYGIVSASTPSIYAVMINLPLPDSFPVFLDGGGTVEGYQSMQYELFPGGASCGGGQTADARDSIRAMYDSTVIFTGQPWKPDCADLVSNVSTSHFTWAELSSQLVHSFSGSLIGVFSAKLLGAAGIDSVRGAYGAALTLSSTYRDPRYNQVVGSTAKRSQHMYGTAADISTTSMTWLAVYDSAGNVPGARVLTAAQDPKCSVTCVHVDWP
jgi:hypothetical protein